MPATDAAPTAPLAAPGATPSATPAAGPIRVRVAEGPEELAGYFRIRREVFVEEQRLFAGSDVDAHDAAAIPIVAIQDGRVIGVVRCYPKHGHAWFGGRLAVHRDHRTGTLGARLVKHAVAVMSARSEVRRFFATVQGQNVRFFERLGWEPRGRRFALNGWEHQVMERRLPGRGA